MHAERLEQYSGNSAPPPPPPPPPGPKSLDVQYSRRTQFPRNFGPRGTEFPRELGPPDRKLVGDRVPCDTGQPDTQPDDRLCNRMVTCACSCSCTNKVSHSLIHVLHARWMRSKNTFLLLFQKTLREQEVP